VTALAAITPESRGAGRAVIITGPQGTYPGSASEGAIAARAVESDAHLAGSRTGTATTRSQLWSAHDAELLHVSAPTVVRGPWRALALADGDVEPPDMIRRGLAPRLAVISGNSSATAMDEEGWGSLASALLESGTEMVIATDRSIEDQSSLPLMTAFYAQDDWATHPARALAQAQVALVGKAGAATPWAAFGALARPPVIPGGSGGGGAP
jgi:CHAT domain-containing protein